MVRPPLTVLVAEDHADLAQILKRSEAFAGTLVEHVKRLSGALERLRANHYDLLLLDLTLPDTQGLPVFQAIQEAAPDLPLVILVDVADARVALETMRLGAQDYLVKGEIDERALKRALSHAIERKKVHLESEEMRQRKNEFVARVNHELRNPMTGIVGFIHLLSKTQLDEVQREYLAAAQKGSKSLLDLLDGLLDLSSAESGNLSIDLQPLNLRECLETTATFIAPQARAKGLEVVASIDPRIPDLILGDNLRLRQVLVNLLGNALKFTEQGYLGLFARVRSLTESEVVIRFVVEDSGRGIPPEKRLVVFQTFGQAHSDDRARGAGLGLAICKELIGAMGGVLGMDSQVGEGTAFWFDLHFSIQRPSSLTTLLNSRQILVLESHPQTQEALVFALTQMGATVYTQLDQSCDVVITDQLLPLPSTLPQWVCTHERGQTLPRHAHYLPRPLRLGDLQPLKASPSVALVAGSAVQVGRILVVDDDPMCRHLLMAVARQCGFGSDEACDGAAALECLLEHTYQMVFLSDTLPDCTGSELAERMRQRGHMARIISLSGSDRPCDLESNRCLDKPLDALALEKLLKLPAAVDWRVLERFKKYQKGANQNLIRELVETFTSTAPGRAQALRQAIYDGNFQEVRRLAHLLRGAAASVGAVAVAAAAGSVEEAPDQPDLAATLCFEVMRSLQVFRQYLEEVPAGSGAI